MIYLYQAAIPTLGVMLYEIFWRKQKRNPLVYIGIFCSICLFSYLLDSYLDAQEPSIHECVLTYDCTLTQEQRDYYFWKIHTHYMESATLSRNSERWLCLLKDKLSENEYHLSNATIVAISTAAFTKDLTTTAVAAAIALLQGLLHDFKHVWEEIKNCLRRVEYHVEMAEFYQNILDRDGE